jgi:polar amino acid transport system substrate-binding protein
MFASASIVAFVDRPMRHLLAHLHWLAAILIAAPAAGATVRMAFGDNLPPYILVREDAGIEIEIVRAALAYRGHVLQASYLPMGRIPIEFVLGHVDAIMMDVGEEMGRHGGHYGTPPVLYDNVFYTLKERGLVIKRPKHLHNLRIISFVGAAKRFPSWLSRIDHSSQYVESNNQAAQPDLLALGRYDAALCDRTIFQYNMNLRAAKAPLAAPIAVVAHPFVQADPLDYRPVFRSAKVRDDFDAGLAELRRSGRYRAIYRKYLEQ